MLLVATYLAMATGALNSTNLSISTSRRKRTCSPSLSVRFLSCVAELRTGELFDQLERLYSANACGPCGKHGVLDHFLSVFMHWDLFTYTFGFLFASLAACNDFLARMLHQKTRGINRLASFLCGRYQLQRVSVPLAFIALFFAEKVRSVLAALLTLVLVCQLQVARSVCLSQRW